MQKAEFLKSRTPDFQLQAYSLIPAEKSLFIEMNNMAYAKTSVHKVLPVPVSDHPLPQNLNFSPSFKQRLTQVGLGSFTMAQLLHGFTRLNKILPWKYMDDVLNQSTGGYHYWILWFLETQLVCFFFFFWFNEWEI